MNRPQTQLQAWADLREKLPARRAEVLDVIRKCCTIGLLEEIDPNPYGCTLFELSEILDKPMHQLSGRITELQRIGVITDSGNRRTNPDSGKKATVWIINADFLRLHGKG